MNLVLKVHGFDKTFTFDAAQITKLTMGGLTRTRAKRRSVDLKDCKAIEKGVSRRHAAIIRRDTGTLSLVDQEQR